MLRRFEQALLRELGYALALEHEAGAGTPIDPGGLRLRSGARAGGGRDAAGPAGW